MTDGYDKAIARFRDWLSEYSPLFAELRTDVFVHDDAPLRLGQLWGTLGWAPGVGFGGLMEPQRPERHVTRAAAERTFKAWQGSANGTAMWARLPARPWVLFTKTWDGYGRERGRVLLVDEDAGDDPVLVETRGGRPTPGKQSATRALLRATVRWHGFHRQVGSFAITPPREASAFEPALTGFHRLARGVWGLAESSKNGKRDARPKLELYYLRGEDLIDYLSATSDRLDRLPGFRYEAEFLVKDLKILHPDALSARGFSLLRSKGRPSAVGRLDGVPLIVHPHNEAPAGSVHVPREHVKRFRELMKAEKLSAYQTLIAPIGPFLEPRPKHRALVKKLWTQAQAPTPSKPARPAGVRKTSSKDDTALLPIEKEATVLRDLLLRSRPELDLEPVKLPKREPRAVRAFWSALGWCRELSSIVGWPDRATSRHELAAAFREYRNGGTPLKRSHLPKLFRVARVDSDGIGVALTDETKGADDPPLLFAVSDTGTISVIASSYLGWVIAELLEHIQGYAAPADRALAAKLARQCKRRFSVPERPALR